MNHDTVARQSAAARTFAVPELLEKIIHDVIEVDYDEDKAPFVLFITRPFVLQRVSRDFCNTILGSSKIRNLCLTNLSDYGEPNYDRLIWLANACGRVWEFRKIRPGYAFARQRRIYLISNNTNKLDGSTNASWRRVHWLPEGVKEPQIEFDVRFHVSLTERPFHRGMKLAEPLRLDQTSTLGQLYDKLEALRSKFDLDPTAAYDTFLRERS